MEKRKKRIGLYPSKPIRLILIVMLSINTGSSELALEVKQAELSDMYQVIPSLKPGASGGDFSLETDQSASKRLPSKKEVIKKLQPISGEVKENTKKSNNNTNVFRTLRQPEVTKGGTKEVLKDAEKENKRKEAVIRKTDKEKARQEVEIMKKEKDEALREIEKKLKQEDKLFKDNEKKKKVKVGKKKEEKVENDYEMVENDIEEQGVKEIEEKINLVVENPKALIDMIRDKFRAERRHKHKIKTIISKNPKFRSEKNLKKIKPSRSNEYEDFDSGNITDDFLFDYAGMINLFSADLQMPKRKLETNPNCSEAFQLYFSQIEGGGPNKPKRFRMTLQGNESATAGWDKYFQVGPHGSSGYGQCFKPNPTDVKQLGKGPCAANFEGTECPFYPDLPIIQKFYPACCDSQGCYCECIYFCTQKIQVLTLLQSSVKEEGFDECTTDVKSVDQGIAWKEEQCKLSRPSDTYKSKESECLAAKSKAVCVRYGNCIKDVCKFCFRWQCEDTSLIKSTMEEEEMRKKESEEQKKRCKVKKKCNEYKALNTAKKDLKLKSTNKNVSTKKDSVKKGKNKKEEKKKENIKKEKKKNVKEKTNPAKFRNSRNKRKKVLIEKDEKLYQNSLEKEIRESYLIPSVQAAIKIDKEETDNNSDKDETKEKEDKQREETQRVHNKEEKQDSYKHKNGEKLKNERNKHKNIFNGNKRDKEKTKKDKEDLNEKKKDITPEKINKRRENSERKTEKDLLNEFN